MPLFALNEIYRVLNKRHGILIVVLPANTPFWVKFPGHFHCMPKENWLDLFGKSGFEVLKENEGKWFAMATEKHEREWRFVLRVIDTPEHKERHQAFFTHYMHTFLRNLGISK